MKHNYRLTNWKKQALAMACLLCLGGSATMAQTRIGVTGTQIFSSKVYDGNTNCGVYYVGQLSGISYLHNVVVTATAHYMDRHVGANKPVVVTYAINGNDADLYLAPANDTLTADITPRPLSITGTQVATKVFDGTTTGTIERFGTLHGVVPIDSGLVYPACLVSFQSPAAGMARPVDVTYSLISVPSILAGNYIAPTAETLTADITPLTIYASGVSIVSRKTYDGTTNCPVISNGTIEGVLGADSINFHAYANFNNPNVGIMKPVTVGYAVGGPNGGNYNIVDTNLHIAAIDPLGLTATLPTVQITKEYDSTDAAFVLVGAQPTNLIGSDHVNIITTARYDNPEPGTGKPINVSYALVGPQASNYAAPATYCISQDGAIILPTQVATIGANGEQLLATATGFCQGNDAGLRYRIQQGTPTQYRLVFGSNAAAQGFANVDWTARTADDTIILFNVPANCLEGDYSVYIQFRNDANKTTDFLPCTFHIDIPNSYLVQVFDDVVSIDNSGNLDGRVDRFTSFQWYHNGEEINDIKPYHQEIGGLTGEYSVRVNLNTIDEGYVCPKTFTPSSKISVVHVYPMPVVNSTNIKLQGFHDGEHLMQVYDNHGAVVFSTTFSGYEYKFDMTTMAPGSYIINIDGRTAKTIKL